MGIAFAFVCGMLLMFAASRLGAYYASRYGQHSLHRSTHTVSRIVALVVYRHRLKEEEGSALPASTGGRKLVELTVGDEPPEQFFPPAPSPVGLWPIETPSVHTKCPW